MGHLELSVNGVETERNRPARALPVPDVQSPVHPLRVPRRQVTVPGTEPEPDVLELAGDVLDARVELLCRSNARMACGALADCVPPRTRKDVPLGERHQ